MDSNCDLETVERFLGSSSVGTSSLLLETEIDILVAFKPLGISKEDKDNFLVVAFISTFITDIGKFVEFVETFSFDLLIDQQFVLLRQTLLEFSSRHSHSVTCCRTFLETVADTLLGSSCQTSTAEVTSMWCKQKLTEIRPVLLLFSTIYEYQDVWVYINEMQWIGADGLKRFYKEYDNVTQVLLGDSESYEMSLLDSMEPCVRLLSEIGSMCQVTTLPNFIDKLSQSLEIATAIEQRAERKLKQIHGRLSEIKDWFVNGVNELVGARSFYVAACNDGVYCLEKLNRCLCLRFESKEDGSGHRIQGTALDDFIYQLTVVHNDQDAAGIEVQAFIDQFHILRDSSLSVFALEALGCIDESFYVGFVCRAGHEHIEEAKRLQKRTQDYVRRSNDWLHSIRVKHPLSLLFQNDELAELYDRITVASRTADTKVYAHIARMVSRVSRFTGRAVNYRDIQSFVEKDSVEEPDGGWLVVVSQFLSGICLHYGLTDYKGCQVNSTIELHSICCENGEVAKSQLAVLGRIYLVREPCY